MYKLTSVTDTAVIDAVDEKRSLHHAQTIVVS